MIAETPSNALNAASGGDRGQQESAQPKTVNGHSRLTRSLGWFSIGLGAAELIAPRAIAKITGTKKNCGLTRLYGLREITAGVGLVTQSNPSPWLWMRFAGDLLDLASLIGGAREDKTLASAASMGVIAGVTVIDLLSAKRASAEASHAPGMQRAEANVLVARPPEECYRFWRDLENIARSTGQRLTVSQIDGKRADWAARMPGSAGKIVWETEMDEDVPGERISWHHLPGGAMEARGSLTFEAAPGGRGTYIRSQIDFDYPTSSLTAPLSRLIGKHPQQLLYKLMRRMKQLMEVGEIITTDGQPAGRRSGTTWLDAIAR